MSGWRTDIDAAKDGSEVLISDGKSTTVAVWTKNAGGGFIGPRGGWKVWDDWALTEVGGYAEDSLVSFTPTMWLPIPPKNTDRT